jgi:hypothetical protein
MKIGIVAVALLAFGPTSLAEERPSTPFGALSLGGIWGNLWGERVRGALGIRSASGVTAPDGDNPVPTSFGSNYTISADEMTLALLGVLSADPTQTAIHSETAATLTADNPQSTGGTGVLNLSAPPTSSTGGFTYQTDATTAQSIYDPQYPPGLGYFTHDTGRFVMDILPGAQATNTDALGFYVRNQSSQRLNSHRQQVGNGVGIFGTISCEATGSACWTGNTTMADFGVDGPPGKGTGKKLIGWEYDITATNAATTIQGIALRGSGNVHAGGGANGYACGSLGAAAAYWDQCFVVSSGTSKGGIFLGSAWTGGTLGTPNVPSVPVDFHYFDAKGVEHGAREVVGGGAFEFLPDGAGNGVALSTTGVGSAPTIQPLGPDANISLNLRAVGTGGIDAQSPLVANDLFAANGGVILSATSTPASSSAPCAAGTFAHDANYIYFCIATNTWKRAPLTTF